MFGLSCSMQTLSFRMWDLVPWSGIEPGPPALGAWSLSHCTTMREMLFYASRHSERHWGRRHNSVSFSTIQREVSLIGFSESSFKLASWSVQMTSGFPWALFSVPAYPKGGSGLLSLGGSEHELDPGSNLEPAIWWPQASYLVSAFSFIHGKQ